MNKRISKRKETLQHHKSMVCKSYTVKVNKSHLSKTASNNLKLLFLEAKWFSNYVIANGIFNTDYKSKIVPVKVKDALENRKISVLSSQMRQSIVEKLKQNVKDLSNKKNNGYKIGKIKFRRFVKTIPLKQHKVTYAIKDKNHISIQNIGRVRVRGLKQIPANVEYANAYLIQDHWDYYLKIVTYQFPEQQQIKPQKAIGIDFGLTNPITFSNGIAVNYKIPITQRIRNLHKQFSRTKEGSRNRQKINTKIQKEFYKLNNIKTDIKNKVVSYLKNNYSIVCFQNDNIRAWQRIWGRKIMDTSVGGIKALLKDRIATPIELSQWFPSTKLCRCGHKNNIDLSEKVYQCPNCGHKMHRDHKAAISIMEEGLKTVSVPMVHGGSLEKDYACGENTTTWMLEYFNSIPYIHASLLYEAGSLTVSA